MLCICTIQGPAPSGTNVSHTWYSEKQRAWLAVEGFFKQERYYDFLCRKTRILTELNTI